MQVDIMYRHVLEKIHGDWTEFFAETIEIESAREPVRQIRKPKKEEAIPVAEAA